MWVPFEKGVRVVIRGTTAQFKFKLPYTKSQLTQMYVVFWQPGNPQMSPIKKTLTDCAGNGSEVSVSLSVAETKQFSDRFKAKMQLKFTCNGVVYGSKPQSIIVYPMCDAIVENT